MSDDRFLKIQLIDGDVCFTLLDAGGETANISFSSYQWERIATGPNPASYLALLIGCLTAELDRYVLGILIKNERRK